MNTETVQKSARCRLGAYAIQKLPQNNVYRGFTPDPTGELTALPDLLAGGEGAGSPPKTPPLRASGCIPSGLAPESDPTNILNRLTPMYWTQPNLTQLMDGRDSV